MATTNINPSQSKRLIDSIFGNQTFAGARNNDTADSGNGNGPSDPDGIYYGISMSSFAMLSHDQFVHAGLMMDFDLSSISTICINPFVPAVESSQVIVSVCVVAPC